jgi:chromatin segregation and condensation protein Rec8/ScpA/Scc1 (kleisin family)
MKEEGSINLAASGTALYSSTTIFKMKSDLILKLEDPPSPPRKIEEVMPPPIQLPFRYEYTFMTMKQLIDSLEVVLRNESLFKSRPQLFSTETAPLAVQKIDKFFANIDDHIQEMYEKIVRLTRDEGEISFLQLIAGMNNLDAIRSFILILFLACRGKIRLRQDEEFGDIYVYMPVSNLGAS